MGGRWNGSSLYTTRTSPHPLSRPPFAKIRLIFTSRKGIRGNKVRGAGNISSLCSEGLSAQASCGKFRWLAVKNIATQEHHCDLRLSSLATFPPSIFSRLEFHRSLAERDRERTSCRFPELLSEWFGSVGRVFYERRTTEILPRVRQTDSRTTRVLIAPHAPIRTRL